MKDNPAFSMVNESDEDEDDMEDDSETGAMLRPSADRTGRNILFKLFQFSAYNIIFILYVLDQIIERFIFLFNLFKSRRRIYPDVWRTKNK